MAHKYHKTISNVLSRIKEYIKSQRQKSVTYRMIAKQLNVSEATVKRFDYTEDYNPKFSTFLRVANSTKLFKSQPDNIDKICENLARIYRKYKKENAPSLKELKERTKDKYLSSDSTSGYHFRYLQSKKRPDPYISTLSKLIKELEEHITKKIQLEDIDFKNK